jgi:hypothetical protein
MEHLPAVAAPGVAERAEALAEAACELHDAVSSDPGRWNAEAVEDAIEAMETTAAALQAVHPDAANCMFVIAHNLGQLRQALGLPPRDDVPAEVAEVDQDQAVIPPTPISRPRRRGLGQGYQGIRIPHDRIASGR